MTDNMVFTQWPSAHLPTLSTRAGVGTIFRSSGIARFVYGGSVKSFRWATRANQMDTAEIIARIKSKVTTKGLELGRPLSNAAILAFERTAGVSLPVGYRDFLLHVGNGGAGPPEYGMLPLGLNGIDASEEEVLSNIGQPFPFDKYWVWETEESFDEERHSTTFHGSINLGTDGCAMYWLLIVNGPQYGQIWNWSDVGIQPLAPARDFLSWYEYWLDGGDDWYADFGFDA